MSIDPTEGLAASVADLDDAAQALVVRDFLPTRQLDFSTNIEAGEIVEQERRMPFAGYVSGMYIRVPDGVDARVGLSLRSETTEDRMFPANDEDTFVGFNAIDRFFPLVFQQAENDKLTFVFDSRSDAPHFINVLIEVVDTEQVSEVI
jgi:hypothetical protein